MRIMDRVESYRKLFSNTVALKPVRDCMEGWEYKDPFERLESLRELNTALSDLYQVSLPVITVWVRDDSYVANTQEIYLREPDLEGFLHQYRHHLQNIERHYQRRGLTAEGLGKEYWDLPYKDCVYRMYGEDDAQAWSKFLVSDDPETELMNIRGG